MRVAVLGTGVMGAPMARNIRAAGHEVSAWNRSPDKAEPLAQDGVTVTGGVAEAGPEAVRERVDPVFDAVGAKTVWLGEAGAAQRLKLVLNTWLLGLTEALAEAIALAEGLGVDPRTFLAAIDGAPVGAPFAQLKAPLMIDGEFPPAFPLALAAKDAGLALEAAEAAGLRLGALAAVGEQMRRAAAAGHGDEDMAATIHASRPA